MVKQLGLMMQSLEAANAEASRMRAEVEQTENRLAATREKLSMAVTKGKSLVQHRDTLKQSLAERTAELDHCRQELQHTSEALHSTKASVGGLESELERRSLELQEKSAAMVSVEASAEELQRLLAEKSSKLERCLLELDQKNDALVSTETNAEELKKLLADKTSELERQLLEFQKISTDLETAKENAEKLSEAQNLVQSLQDLLSHRDMIIQDIEERLSQYDSSPEVLSMGVIDRLKWLIDQKQVADAVFLDTHKIRDALSTIDLPEDILSVDLESQIHWLGKSLAQSRTDLIKLQHEITSARDGVDLYESDISEARNQIERLTATLLEERQRNGSLQDEVGDLTRKYEEMDEKLISLSSQKDELMKLLVEVFGSTDDEQPSVGTTLTVEKCIGKIKEMTRANIFEKEQFDRVQSLLYVKDQELTMLQDMFDEVKFDRSEMESMSTKLGSAREEIASLRNERDSLQKELERVEERSSQIRDRLSLAVRKGKGLVQERDGYKHSLDEKTTQIEMLNQELQRRDSVIAEYVEKINTISVYTEHIQKLESDVVSLKDQRDEINRILQERNNMLQKLLLSVESVVIPTDKHFEEPVEKVNWIAEHIHKSEIAQTHIEQELEKVNEEVTLQSSKLVDAFTTIQLLENQLSKATEEKKGMQMDRSSMEQELENMKEEHHKQACKLADAYTTIKSLEDLLSNAETQISLLNSERTEVETRNKLEINTLNTKLAECMEELARTHGSLESKSDELTNQIGDLQVFVKDGSLLSLMTEEFRKKVEDLRDMGYLIRNIQEQLAAKGLHISGSEHPDLTKLHSLPEFEDFMKDRMVHLEIITGEAGDVPSFTKLVEVFRSQATLFGDTFKDLSSYMDSHIALTVKALQGVRDQFIHIVEVNESLTTNLEALEAQNKAQEFKIASLQNEIMGLLSACTDASQELQVELHDFIGLDSSSKPDKMSFDLESTSKEEAGRVAEQLDGSESTKVAKSLLLAARSIRNNFEELASARSAWITSISDLENKLKQAELTAETAVRDGNLNQERVSKLQVDLDALQIVCSEMKVKIEEYQAREDVLRDKEAEILSSKQTLSSKHSGLGDELFLQDQMETLIDKINSMEVPSNVAETESQVFFSSPFDKLFYILDKVTELQHKIESLSYEKEVMQLSLGTHSREIEHLKEAAETASTDNQDFELKKIELTDLTVGLERIIQRLAGNYSLEDQKPITAKRLLPVLERLISASILESEKLKSRMQELAVELLEKENVANELSKKVKFLEGSIRGSAAQPDSVKERAVFESSTSATGSEISEIEDLGPLAKSSKSPASAAAHVRTMRKGSADHLVLNVDPESERLISAWETDDKGHFFKSLNASGLIPKQGKSIADRVDGIWVSVGRILMSKPGARLGLIGYYVFLHLWLLGTIL